MKKLIYVSILVIAMITQSCMTTKTSVGTYTQQTGREYTYAKGKQLWIFWGIIPLGRTNVATPGDGNCQVITHYTFSDFLITGLTAGIIDSYSIKVKAKRQDKNSVSGNGGTQQINNVIINNQTQNQNSQQTQQTQQGQ